MNVLGQCRTMEQVMGEVEESVEALNSVNTKRQGLKYVCGPGLGY